jgi:hypothetical protein
VLLLVFSAVAAAHTKLAGSSPSADALVPAPTELVLEFGGDVRLTAVSLATAGGAAVQVDAVPTVPASKFSLAVREPLAPGEYVVVWRAVGGDTHIVSGEFRFSVAGAHSH